MSEQQITIVRDNSSSEVKVFVGGELRGRYKEDSTALAHLATALVELTAAQQQVAELERELNRRKVEQLKKPTVTDVLSVCEELTAENAELRRLVDRHDKDYMAVQKQVDRLRELLRECREYLPADLQDFIDAELAKGAAQ